DCAFLLYAVYIPLLIAIYILELIVILRHRRQYYSSFYLIFSVIAAVDVLACLIGTFLFRLPLYPIVYGYYESLLGKRAWIPPLHALGYYFNCLSQYLGVLMAANRFTAIFTPNYHDKIWRYLLIGVLLSLVIAVIPVWILIQLLYEYPIAFVEDTQDAEYPFFVLEVHWIPQKAIWLNMAEVTVVCNLICTFIYVACLIKLSLYSISRNSTVERNFFIVGFSSMVISLPYTAVMPACAQSTKNYPNFEKSRLPQHLLFMYLVVIDKLPFDAKSMLFVFYQVPWVTDLKYLSLAPILLITNISIRRSITAMFRSKREQKAHIIISSHNYFPRKQ
ncbi:hypothetical protein PMAYCL1PPCAC_32856, partial [Pristionchus mayeri]